MNFFLVGIVYWLLIGASILLFILGILKKSWKAFLWSGIALLLPSIAMFAGDTEGLFRWIGVLSLILFGLAYWTKK
ncbi:hypothetical protein V7161_20530 [Neobacillus drentensis]|uniref:hypothetical protein n=1 Tax=Neobacillus drentensis TaxID=220684 RepID=UPI0030032A16